MTMKPRAHVAHREPAIRDLLEAGVPADQIPARLNATPGALHRWLRRHGHNDLARLFPEGEHMPRQLPDNYIPVAHIIKNNLRFLHVDDALCRDNETHLFTADTLTADELAQAKAICRRCPLRRACLQAALDNKEEDGIWGGFTPAARRKMRLTRRAA